MPDRLQTYPVQFQGGLVTNISQLQQGIEMPGSAVTLINFEPSIDGGYRRIEGFTKYDDAVVPGTGLIRGVFYFDDATYAVRNEHVYVSSGTGWTQVTDNVAYSSSGVTLTDITGLVRFEKFDYDGTPTMILVDSVNKPFRLKGGVFEELTGLPTDTEEASHARSFKDHLFIASGKNVLFSAPFSEDDFSAASGGGSINVGSAVTGLITFRELLIIFTETSIFQLAGNTIADFQLNPITRDLGCVESDTIQEFGGDVMFLAPDGLRLLSATERNNDFGLAVVSKPIQNKLVDLLTISNSFSSVVIRAKSQYRLLGFNSNYTNDAGKGIIGVQKALQGGIGTEWSETLGINARVAYSDYIESLEIVLFANGDGYVYNMESGNNFDGENIPATFRTPFFTINDPNVRKQLHKIQLFTDPKGTIEGDVTVKYDFDDPDYVQPESIAISNTATDVALYGRAVYGTDKFGGTLRKLFNINAVGSGEVISLQFTSNTNNPPFSLDAVSLQYLQSGRR